MISIKKELNLIACVIIAEHLALILTVWTKRS